MTVQKKQPKVIFETNLPLPLLARGKVRDIYVIDEQRLLIIATDRLSAFDLVLPNPIPYRGKVLTQISAFWFKYMEELIPNHLITTNIEEMGLPVGVVEEFGEDLIGRTMLVHRAKPLPVECVVRGYITGSGWKDYLQTQTIGGLSLPAGLQHCQAFPEPIFTPSTKATHGHDENINLETMQNLVGAELAEQLHKISIAVYQRGANWALQKGIIIADTKFEFGLWRNQLILIDEVLTPDSSRFWPKDQYQAGRDQPSFDKQIVRNYLITLGWDRNPPPPELPEHIIQQTMEAYQDAYRRLTGRELVL